MNNQTLFEKAKKYGNPIVEGNQVTFIWKGKTAPYLIDDIHMWEDHPQKMKRIEKDFMGLKNTVYNGIGHYNHFFYMPGHSATELANRRKNIPRGKVTHHLVETWMLADDGERDMYLYHPPVSGPVPLLVVYDGPDYLERAKLNVIVIT
ncbi:MAG: hypothetical protein IPL71_22705 [Anaerolineales bacterium]|uniref:hypothetical protein n=1 Tax=Candidatus Villigracilis proximus TaxID=3140683 RepID=UPI003134AB78|nr:hypothetical protein [Anaerolineales bacterium]